MSMVRVRPKGQITVPAVILDAMRIRAGDYLMLNVSGENIILTPQQLGDRKGTPPAGLAGTKAGGPKVATTAETDPQRGPHGQTETKGDRLMREAQEVLNSGSMPDRQTMNELIKTLRKEFQEDRPGG